MNDVFDDPNTKADEAAAQAAANAEKTKTADLHWLMSSPRGRRLVWGWLGESGVYRTSFNNSGSIMAFNEGKRSLGLAVMAETSAANPEGFDLMLAEQRKKNA